MDQDVPSLKQAFQHSRPPEQQGRLTADQLLGNTNDSKKNKFQLLLEYNGIPTSEEGDEFIGDCPFFDCPSFIESKPNKFTCNKQTCQWRCFVCGRAGNAPLFIREIHRNFLEQTTESMLHDLRKMRNFAVDLIELKELQTAFNSLTKEWALPAWNAEGKLTNLYTWRTCFDGSTGRSYRQLFSAPSFHQIPYGLHRIRHGSNRTLLVLEGHWDYIAMMGLLRRLDKTAEYDIIAAPGPLPRNYLDLFNGRHACLMCDNDVAGTAMMDSICSGISKNNIMPLSLKRLTWPTGLPNKYDVSDVITSLPQPLRKKKSETVRS